MSDEIKELTRSVNGMREMCVRKFAVLERGQSDLTESFAWARQLIQQTRDDQLQCPARMGWDEFRREVRNDIHGLEDDTKQITIRNAERNGKASKTPKPFVYETPTPPPIWGWIRERLGITLAMAAIAGISFLTQRCTSNDTELAAQITGARAQIERVSHEVKVNAATADAMLEVLESDTTGD